MDEELAERFERLSRRQIECLELASQHYSSKQIARILPISKPTIDQHLDRARKIIGAQDRAEAVRLFDQWRSYDRIMHDPAALAEPTFVSSPSPPIEYGQATARTDRIALREDRVTFQISTARRSVGTRILAMWGGGNDLTTYQRLALVGAAALGTVIVAAGLTATAWSVVRMVRDLIRAF